MDNAGKIATAAGGIWPGRQPALGDFDGDGRADPAVYKSLAADFGIWCGLLSARGYALEFGRFGGSEYAPVGEY